MLYTADRTPIQLNMQGELELAVCMHVSSCVVHRSWRICDDGNSSDPTPALSWVEDREPKDDESKRQSQTMDEGSRVDLRFQRTMRRNLQSS